ncbi:hypothetical protein THAOC_08282 [Thalassiosira oceanica]|uniref:RING-type domain-containing protein n=1 Tax=Thalassiosira oceanica TaxID=159749 RepID=K0SZD5_THAOC|nr:hypothetical protein THAOC_08282 [Thalassiosira oceanica]|eukprot:EJK70364.1 hypothetical protein THAOC_08282 [Thalassiosira oceanica]
MAENAQGDAAVVTERMCGICLEESKDPLDLPCGHSFCDGCLNEWRSRYGVEEEMRRKCPICRARIPPSREMVASLLSYRAHKQKLEDINDTSSERYHAICYALEQAEEKVGADWDGVTVLEDNNDKSTVEMPDYIRQAIIKGDNISVLRWINANQAEDRANAVTSAEMLSAPALSVACIGGCLELMTLLLQLGANINARNCKGITAIQRLFTPSNLAKEGVSDRPELNGKTCVADEYLPDSNQYKVTLETKSKEVLVLSPGNLKLRDRTPQDCGYYVEYKHGRTIRRDFDSSEDCQAFVAALNRDETQPSVTKEAEARAEQAATELLAELGLDESQSKVSTGDDHAKRSKKKKGGKKKRRK